jgi:bifunctional enzyme CysN/CysC
VLNDIGRVRFRTMEPLVADLYAQCRETGAFIIIDPATRHTVGAGMIRRVDAPVQAGTI